jgi:hypothetical protein
MKVRAAIFIALFFLVGGGLRADQLEMQNGDRYNGKVISMTADTVILQSDVLGKITLPRGKVANINLGAIAAMPVAHSTNQAKASSLTQTNVDPDIATALRQLGANTNFIERVRKQFLSDAGPEANNKFDELVGGLFSGKLDIESIRAQAKQAADQIRELKRQGGDVGDLLDSYLAILDNFLKETAHPAPSPPAVAPGTNSARSTTILR